LAARTARPEGGVERLGHHERQVLLPTRGKDLHPSRGWGSRERAAPSRPSVGSPGIATLVCLSACGQLGCSPSWKARWRGQRQAKFCLFGFRVAGPCPLDSPPQDFGSYRIPIANPEGANEAGPVPRRRSRAASFPADRSLESWAATAARQRRRGSGRRQPVSVRKRDRVMRKPADEVLASEPVVEQASGSSSREMTNRELRQSCCSSAARASSSDP